MTTRRRPPDPPAAPTPAPTLTRDALTPEQRRAMDRTIALLDKRIWERLEREAAEREGEP